MTILPRLAGLAVATLVVAACTTLDPEERARACAATDWERYGLNDGKLGVTTSSRADEFETCANVGHPIDLAAYQRGRIEGLVDYCTTESGYRVGYEGRVYGKVCPPTLEPDFLQGFNQGRKDRPALALYPSIGIGIGSRNGHVRSGIGIGIGIGSFFGCNRYGPHRRRYGHCW
ncbi:MAG: DUF2799 domain-containing protein [Pseudomonadota bacterium]